MNECPCMLLCHSNPPKSAIKGGTVVPPSNFQFVTTKCLMKQTLTSLSSHGCAQAYARQILYMLSWLPVDNNCSSKCPNKHLTALTQTLANTRQLSSHLANYCPTTIDNVQMTTYLAAFHVSACTPMATTKEPSNSRQMNRQHTKSDLQKPRKRPVCSCVTAALHPTNSPQTTLFQPSAILSFTCNSHVNLMYITCKSLVTCLRFTCPTIALLLRDN